ncbi:MAG: NAD(P)/FAD-dependent oxidoreductase [Anaerolineaceae bacterium]|nr:NAD(P)/FAD-dependent oxidoreductase [Anaerolineaceae bacterium]
MSSKNKIVIIGAGVAGLSAGIYAQMNGFDVTIYEMHSLPGGLCTSWRRRGYTFDGAVRYLAGVNPKTKGYQLWEELGILEDTPIHFYEEFVAIEGRDGRTLHLYTDVDRLEKHLLALAPQDKRTIGEFVEGIRDFTRMELHVDLTAEDMVELAEMGKDMLPVLMPTLRWRTKTLTEYADKFTDPLLREGLRLFFQFAPADFPMMLCLSTLAMMNDHEAGYPMGGSLPVAKGLASRFESLGGEIVYRTRVKEVLVENDRAAGVVLANGRVDRSDIVISASDGRATIFDLLGGKYIDEKIRHTYNDGMIPCKSILQVSLGVAMDFSDLPPMINFPLDQPVWLGNIRHDRMVLKHYCFDPQMAPKGKSSLSLWFEADSDYWQWLYPDDDRYDDHKEEVAEIVIDALEKRFPGLRDAVEVVNVATPVTYQRYTGNWRGAFAGWALTTRKMSMMMGKGMDKTLPGLDHFYMIGQWVEPGGNVELSCASGRDVVKDICHGRDQAFKPEE